MLAVTPSANNILSEILTKKEAKPEQTFRVIKSTMKDNDLEFIWDKEEDDDQVVKNEQGRTVLVIKSDLADSLDGMTLHYSDNPNEPGFVVQRYSSGS